MNIQRQYKRNNEVMDDFEIKRENKPKVIIANKKNKKKYILMLIGIVFIAFFGIIARYSYITQLNYDVAQLNKDITKQVAINSSLSIELDKKMNLPQVRYNATTKLGMQKPDNYQIVYIEVPRCDKVYNASPPSNFYDIILHTIKDIKVSFGNIRSIFS